MKKTILTFLVIFLNCVSGSRKFEEMQTYYFRPISPVDSILPNIINIETIICKEVQNLNGNTIIIEKGIMDVFRILQKNQIEKCINDINKKAIVSEKIKYPYLVLRAYFDHNENIKYLNIGIMNGPKAGYGKEYKLIERDNKIEIGNKVNEWKS